MIRRYSLQNPNGWHLCKRVLLLFVIVHLATIPHASLAAPPTPPAKAPLLVAGDYNFPPYEYLNRSGNPTGYNVELIQAVGEIMGLEVEIRLGPWADVREALEDGEVDALQGMFYSEARDQQVDFSTPHTIVYHAIFVRKGNTEIQSIEDLQGKAVLVQEGDIMHDYALGNGLTNRLIPVRTPEAALRQLASGNYDAALIAKLQGLFLAEQYNLSNLTTVGEPFYPTEYCFAVQEGDWETLELLNEGLRILKATGQYKKIYDRWLGILEPPGISRVVAIRYGFIILIPLLLLLVSLSVWSWSLKRQIAEITQALESGNGIDDQAIMRLPWYRLWVPTAGLFILTILFAWFNEICDLPNLLFATESTPVNWQEALLETIILLIGGFFTVANILRSGKARRQIEAALSESEKRYRSYINNAPDAIFIFDQSGQCLEVNPTACKLTGYPEAELLTLSLSDLLRSEDEEAGNTYLSELTHTGRAQGELTFRHKNDHRIYVLIEGVALSENRYLGFGKDINKQKQTEHALQQYTERLRALHAIDGAILAAWSPTEIAQAALRHIRNLVPCWGATIIMLDREATQATFFAVNIEGEIQMETQTNFPIEIVPDIEALQMGQVIIEEDILRSSQPQSIVDYIQASDVRSFLAAPLITQGKLIGILGLGAKEPRAFLPEHIDIVYEVANQIAVALKQAELHIALETEQQRLKALVADLPQGVMLLDKEKRIQLVNQAAEVCLPYLTESRVGEVVTHIANHPLEEILAPPPEGLWHELEITGTPCLIVEIAARPIGSSNQAGGWVIVFQNVTQERETQQRVQQQERLAVIGQMAGGIAHDFNNFLTTIMLYAQMPLKKPGLPPDLIRAFDTILGESQKAAELIQQILDFSRRSQISAAPLNLEPFIKEIVKILRHTIPENITLTFEAEPGSYIVNADITRLQQAFMNLIVNARDAMPGGGEVKITLTEKTTPHPREQMLNPMPAGNWICLAVSDTGVGIPPEVMAHLFEPFFTTKAPGKGTGLGLAQVYGIVNQHKGYIGIETRADHGTTFRIYLPAYQGEKLEGEFEKGTTIPRGHGEVILIVEDKDELRTLVQSILESLGYQVISAENGYTALGAYHAAEHIDLLLTDLIMPTLGGKELILALWKEAPHLHVIVMTGYGVDNELTELKKEKTLTIIQKPFDTYALAQAIYETLKSE